MKQKETLLSSEELRRLAEMGDEHVGTSHETPLRLDAFEKDDDQKIKLIAEHFREILLVLGMNLNDDSIKGTPHRVAKMFVKEIFEGLNPANRPDVRLFANKYKYKQMLVEKDIPVYSFCEHHFVPIVGKAHCAYISSGHVIGLSKINRIVHYFAHRPQVQERMTIQIANELIKVLKTDDVAVMIEAEHLCVSARGVRDSGVSTVTSEYSGKFLDVKTREEFLSYVHGGK